MKAAVLAVLAILLGAHPAKQADVKTFSNVQTVGPGERSSRLLRLKDMGVFDVTCDHGEARVVFTAGHDQTEFVTFAPAGAKPQTAQVDPGTGWAPGSATYATWQVANFSEGTVDVATVGFASYPWSSGCVVALQGTVERRQRQSSLGVAG